jgi:selenocysteine lyase/cysteine desulfurase
MWRILDQGREGLREKLANLCGVLPEEIAINRNATEGLNTVIFGLNLKAGDEVVLSTFDYPNMMNAWKQREKRDKIKLVWINIPQPLEDEKAIVKLYQDAITSKTKIVHITHMINWTGNFVPTKAIADMAHAKGCEVIVDGAHSFAQIDFKIEDTGADYFATALHKWLGAPFGTGLLYIKKEKINQGLRDRY